MGRGERCPGAGTARGVGTQGRVRDRGGISGRVGPHCGESAGSLLCVVWGVREVTGWPSGSYGVGAPCATAEGLKKDLCCRLRSVRGVGTREARVGWAERSACAEARSVAERGVGSRGHLHAAGAGGEICECLRSGGRERLLCVDWGLAWERGPVRAVSGEVGAQGYLRCPHAGGSPRPVRRPGERAGSGPGGPGSSDAARPRACGPFGGCRHGRGRGTREPCVPGQRRAGPVHSPAPWSRVPGRRTRGPGAKRRCRARRGEGTAGR